MVTASKPGEVGGGGVGAVGAVGDQDLGAFFALVAEVGGGDEQGGEFALSAGGGLEADGVEPGDLGQVVLKFEEDLEHALERGFGLVGVEVQEAGQAGQALVSLGVVLHGTGAKRVEVGVDRHVGDGEVRVVADDVELAEFGQRGGGGGQVAGGQQVCRGGLGRRPGRGQHAG